MTYEQRMLILDDNDHNRTLIKFAMQMAALAFETLLLWAAFVAHLTSISSPRQCQSVSNKF